MTCSNASEGCCPTSKMKRRCRFKEHWVQIWCPSGSLRMDDHRPSDTPRITATACKCNRIEYSSDQAIEHELWHASPKFAGYEGRSLRCSIHIHFQHTLFSCVLNVLARPGRCKDDPCGASRRDCKSPSQRSDFEIIS